MLMRIGDGPREHDYTTSMWGHALHSPEMVEAPVPFWRRWAGKPPAMFLRCLGHGDVRVGDTILLKMASGRVARFKAAEVEYFRDPDDMFNLKRADFLGYVDEDAAV